MASLHDTATVPLSRHRLRELSPLQGEAGLSESDHASWSTPSAPAPSDLWKGLLVPRVEDPLIESLGLPMHSRRRPTAVWNSCGPFPKDHLVNTHSPRRAKSKALAVIAVTTGLLAAAVSFGSGAHAATAIPLGTSAQFAVLAGAGVTNTGSTTIQTADASVRGDVGTSPTNTITGDAGISWISPATGGFHKADEVALQAQADNLIGYNAAAGAPSSSAIGGQLDTLTLLAGVHTASSALNLAENGTVTLDAENDPAAVFVLQVGSSLTMEVGSTVALINGANPCNIFWQVSQDATIKSNAVFQGTLLAENAIVAQSGADFVGRLLAQNASVTLNNNTFVLPACGDAAGDDEDDETGDGDGVDADGTDSVGGDADETDADGTDADGTAEGDGASDADADADISPAADSDAGAAADGAAGALADDDSSSQDLSLPDTGGPSYGLWIAAGGLFASGAVVLIIGHSPRGAHRRA